MYVYTVVMKNGDRHLVAADGYEVRREWLRAKWFVFDNDIHAFFSADEVAAIL